MHPRFVILSVGRSPKSKDLRTSGTFAVKSVRRSWGFAALAQDDRFGGWCGFALVHSVLKLILRNGHNRSLRLYSQGGRYWERCMIAPPICHSERSRRMTGLGEGFSAFGVGRPQGAPLRRIVVHPTYSINYLFSSIYWLFLGFVLFILAFFVEMRYDVPVKK